MGPNKPKKGQRTKSGEQASGEADMGEAEEGIVMRVMEAITDERILTLLKKALYPQPLDDKLQRMNDIIEALTKTISERDARIQQLERKVDTIEQEMDRLEQYTRRSNLVFRGIAETDQGENTDAKILSLVNSEMKITPALALSDIARSHRLGKKREGTGNRRAIIVRFNSDRVRDCVYRGRVNLKDYNQQHRDHPVFINDDLTARRSKLAFECRQLKKEKKISDTWTYYGKLIVKDLSSNVSEVTCEADLRRY